jgi:monoamine oxidase
MSKFGLNIAIAGAGISGLIAGIELQRAGYQVSIFESSPRTGGRIESIEMAGVMVETGPEFIHGHLKETLGLLKKYKIRYETVHGKMYMVRDGKISENYEMADGWDQLLEKMKSIDEDQPLNEFLEKYFSGDNFNELKKTAIRFAEGFDLADTGRASTKALIAEWEYEESGQFRIPSGYGTLVKSVENEFTNLGGKIFLNHKIERVDWDSVALNLYIRDQKKMNPDKLVISLPLSLLNQNKPQSESIVFHPSIDEKQKAFSQIGFGTVIKIVMIWNSPFWNQIAPDAQFIISDNFIPTWWTQFPQGVPVLTGWMGGPRAEQFSDKPDSFFLEKAFETLSSLFSVSVEKIKQELRDVRIFNWMNNPWSCGAYSYSLVGSGAAKAICRKSIQNRIYFTGEAYYDGPFPGTVEAAVVSGLETARQFLQEQ